MLIRRGIEYLQTYRGWRAYGGLPYVTVDIPDTYFGSRPCVGQILTKGALATIDLADNDTRNNTGFCVLFYPVSNLLPFPWDIDSAHYSLSNFMSLISSSRFSPSIQLFILTAKAREHVFPFCFSLSNCSPIPKATALIATSPCFT